MAKYLSPKAKRKPHERLAYLAIRAVCKKRKNFTVEEVWRLMPEWTTSGERRWMGKVMIAAAKDGLCASSARRTVATRGVRHKGLTTLWVSLCFAGAPKRKTAPKRRRK